ncbi:fibrinogen-like protein 1 [Littorina saxatilis]|uniref:Fibrinogen C-terminal domain-containing protein n=1 Tax=Littorina saxatilis TaxID=31220 RepID=A0AAN9AJ89_9CAEN
MAFFTNLSTLYLLALLLPLFLAASTSPNDVLSSTLEVTRTASSSSDNNKHGKTDNNNTATTNVEPKRQRRRNRRCKCLKRFTKEVSQMIDERLEDFENKYLLHLNRDKEQSLAMQNEASSTTSRIQSIDKLLLRLNTDVVQTKEALSMMNSNLDVLRYELNHTRGDVRQLNVSFKELDVAVANLTHFVSRVEKMIPQGLTSPGPGGAVVSDPPKENYPRNCDEVFKQGGMQFQGDYYIMIKPDGVAHPFKVLCKIYNNSGWTVIQKRQDGSVDFFRTWEEYRTGFGSLEGEFWLGNNYIYHLSVQEPTMLRIEMTDWEGRTYYGEYDSFRIDNEKGLYRLHIGNYNGDAGDSLRSHWENHDGMPFSTKDRDNDGRYYDSCAEHFHGAWWFNNCFDSHLNGKYYHKGFHKNYFQRDGIQWNTIHMYSSLKSVHMMIKPAEAPVESEDDQKAMAAGKKDRSRSKGKGKGRGASKKDRKRM